MFAALRHVEHVWRHATQQQQQRQQLKEGKENDATGT